MLAAEGKLPDAVLACVGGGSNAIGAFYDFIEDEEVRLIGCEAAGHGIDTERTAATMATGKLGIFHGMKSYFWVQSPKCNNAWREIQGPVCCHMMFTADLHGHTTRVSIPWPEMWLDLVTR